MVYFGLKIIDHGVGFVLECIWMGVHMDGCVVCMWMGGCLVVVCGTCSGMDVVGGVQCR